MKNCDFVLTYGEPLSLVDCVVAELGRPRLVVIVRFVLLTDVYLQTSTVNDNTRLPVQWLHSSNVTKHFFVSGLQRTK